jgi:phosphoglycerate dehydrogenase-like enzyme
MQSMQRIVLSLALLALPLCAQPLKIVVQNPAVLKELQASGEMPPQVKLVAASGAALTKEIADADAFIGSALNAEQLKAAKKLRWVQSWSAGVENQLFLSGNTLMRDSTIVLTNNRIVEGPELADHALAMLLTLTRQIPRFMANQAKETWQGGSQGILVLKDKTAVVIGVGGAGFNIATRAWAFGMTVIGVDPEDYPMTPIIKKYVKPDQLDDVLPEADVVFVSAPHTEQSRHMMGKKQFELMKQGSYFVAVSRGGLYDMNSLVTALDSKRLAGAGVDVTEPEPLPKGHPLWKFSNVIITPHVAGRSDQDYGRMVGTARENIKRFAAGKPLINVVNKQKGY